MRALSVWNLWCSFLVTHSQHGELPKIMSSDQDLTITVLNLQVLSPVWGNETYQLPFQGECCVVCFNSPCQLPLPACHPSADTFPCTHITPAPRYNPGPRPLSCLSSFADCPLLSFQSSPSGFRWHFIAIWGKKITSCFLLFVCFVYGYIILVAKRRNTLNEVVRFSSHDLAVTLTKTRVFSTQGNTCWESLLLVACEQTCLMASQVFWRSQNHLFPPLRSLVRNVTISRKKKTKTKNSRHERQRKSFWLIPGSGRYQDALAWLFSAGAQGGRGGSWCWAPCLALSHTQVPPWQNNERWLWSSSFKALSRVSRRICLCTWL